MRSLSRLLERARDRPLTGFAAVVALLGVAVLVVVLAPGPRHKAKPGSGRAASASMRPARSSPPPASAPQPAKGNEPAAARAVARAFLEGYLAYSYGHTRVVAIPDADPRLIASLQRQRPRVPAAAARRDPKVTSLQLLTQARGAIQATATVDDGSGVSYPLVAYLDRHPNGWVVTRLGDD